MELGPRGRDEENHDVPSLQAKSDLNGPDESTKLAAIVGFCLILLFGARFASRDALETFILKLQLDPYGSLTFFVLVHVLGIVCLVPGMLFSVIGGAAYGPWLGAILSWFATAVGQTLAFLLGRYLLQNWVNSFLASRVSDFEAVSSALSKEGWKLVLLLRLSPAMPYNVLNYALSVTPVGTMAFAVPSAIAIIPYSISFAYMGSMSKDIVALVRGNMHGRMGIGWLTASVAVLAISLFLIATISKRAIQNVIETNKDIELEEMTPLQGSLHG